MATNFADLSVVILAGGAGTRFWPLSTERRPKQFLKLTGQRTLLQQSYDRVADMVVPERVLVLTNARFVAEVRAQLPELPPDNVVGEPMRRDTAAAVALAVALCERRFGGGVMTMLTADHHIEPKAQFQRTLRSAVDGARQHPRALYTFGIKPTCASTSYGYLQLGDCLNPGVDISHHVLKQFREKPDLDTARGYLESGQFVWNSGMFVWTVEAIAAELGRHLPDHMRRMREAASADGTTGFGEALTTAFEPLSVTSIDYAVMERATQVHCVTAQFDWSDVGGWVALEAFLDRDKAGNAVRGRIYSRDASDNLVFCDQDYDSVALLGVRDLIVIRAGHKTLVMPKQRAEELKQLVKSLPDEQR